MSLNPTLVLPISLARFQFYATEPAKLALPHPTISFDRFTFLMLENGRNVIIDEAQLIKGLCLCYMLYKCMQSIFSLLITGLKTTKFSRLYQQLF